MGIGRGERADVLSFAQVHEPFAVALRAGIAPEPGLIHERRHGIARQQMAGQRGELPPRVVRGGAPIFERGDPLPAPPVQIDEGIDIAVADPAERDAFQKKVGLVVDLEQQLAQGLARGGIGRAGLDSAAKGLQLRPRDLVGVDVAGARRLDQLARIGMKARLRGGPCRVVSQSLQLLFEVVGALAGRRREAVRAAPLGVVGARAQAEPAQMPAHPGAQRVLIAGLFLTTFRHDDTGFTRAGRASRCSPERAC